MDLRPRNRIDAGFSLSSMTDLVFLLLIFFVIVSTMISPTTIPVDLPISANKTKEKPRVGVRIDADSHFSVNNVLLQNPLDLEGRVKDAMREQKENAAILLHVDRTVPSGVTVSVMEIAKRNGWNVIMATRPK